MSRGSSRSLADSLIGVPLEAVRAETRAHDYDQVILATSRQGGPWLPRLLRRDPVHRLRRRCKQPLSVLPLGQAAPSRGG